MRSIEELTQKWGAKPVAVGGEALDPKMTFTRPLPIARYSGSKLRGRARTQPKRDGSMNKLEQRYAEELEQRRHEGRLARWDFEPCKLRLADRTYYTPDFRVVLVDGTLEFHEVKGTWCGQEHNRVKLKVAAELHPYDFVCVMPRPRKDGGGWKEERL